MCDLAMSWPFYWLIIVVFGWSSADGKDPNEVFGPLRSAHSRWFFCQFLQRPTVIASKMSLHGYVLEKNHRHQLGPNVSLATIRVESIYRASPWHKPYKNCSKKFFLANLQFLGSGISAQMQIQFDDFNNFIDFFRWLISISKHVSISTSVLPERNLTTSLLLHSVLDWIHKYHKFFWLSALHFLFDRYGIDFFLLPFWNAPRQKWLHETQDWKKQYFWNRHIVWPHAVYMFWDMAH